MKEKNFTCKKYQGKTSMAWQSCLTYYTVLRKGQEQKTLQLIQSAWIAKKKWQWEPLSKRLWKLNVHGINGDDQLIAALKKKKKKQKMRIIWVFTV